METHPQGPLWGGYRFYIPSPHEMILRRQRLGISVPSPFTISRLTHLQNLPKIFFGGLLRIFCYAGLCTSPQSIFQAFESAVWNEASDKGSHIMMTFSYAKVIDQYILSVPLVHIAGTVEPKIFAPFYKLKHVYSQSAIMNMSELVSKVDYFNLAGERYDLASFPSLSF